MKSRYYTPEYKIGREKEETIRQSERSLVKFRADVEAAKEEEFNWRTELTKAAKDAHVERMVSWMTRQLDTEKHDARNDAQYVQDKLRAYYKQCPDGIITPSGFDRTFAVYSPYSGTY